ncbi:MAG TPA: hypothetical protein VK659_08410 [Asanoa sp.]|nr:hypothetical protein [Asanoa sp.]
MKTIHPDWRVPAVLGVAALGASWWLLNDAYVRRGIKPPVLLRPFMWWR